MDKIIDVYKVVMIGDNNIGKSAIVIQFIQGYYLEKYDPTIEDSYYKNIIVNGDVYKIEIVDTGSSDCIEIMDELYIKYGDGFIITYSILSESSFEKAKQLHQKIINIKNDVNFPCILCGNKLDSNYYRVVSKKTAKLFAKKINCPYIETSAKYNINIFDMYRTIVNIIRRHKKNKYKKSSCIIL